MQNKESNLEFFASCLPGAERALACELKSYGVSRVRPLKGGVAFFCEPVCAYRACLWSRVASRVVLVLARIAAADADILYASLYEIKWEEILSPRASFTTRAQGSNDALRNTRFTALKAKDAIADRLREYASEHGSGSLRARKLVPAAMSDAAVATMPGSVSDPTLASAPAVMSATVPLSAPSLASAATSTSTSTSTSASVSTSALSGGRLSAGEHSAVKGYASEHRAKMQPRAAIDIRLHGEKATVSLDFSGEALNHRSYLFADDKKDAPYRCSLAASALMLANWNLQGDCAQDVKLAALVDPVCSDGVFLIEAASIACDLAPGLFREKWGFFAWAQFEEESWRALIHEAHARFDAGLCFATGVSDVEELQDLKPSQIKTRYIGTSTSSPSIALARKHVRKAGLRGVVSVELGDAQSLPVVVNRASENAREANAHAFRTDDISRVDDISRTDETARKNALSTTKNNLGTSENAAETNKLASENAAETNKLASENARETNKHVTCVIASNLDAQTRSDAAAQVKEQETSFVAAAKAAAIYATNSKDTGSKDTATADTATADTANTDTTTSCATTSCTANTDTTTNCATTSCTTNCSTNGKSARPSLPTCIAVEAQDVSSRFDDEAYTRTVLGKGRVEAKLEIFFQPPKSSPHIKVIDLDSGLEHAVEVYERNSEQFAARLRKVFKERRKEAARRNVSCYRIYDYDLPEYAVAIDWYSGWGNACGNNYLSIAEYAAPSSVDPDKARKRFHDVLAIAPVVCGVRSDHVFSKRRVREKGGSQYARTQGRAYVTTVEENGFTFEVDLAQRLDTGLFLDHRITRELVQKHSKNRDVLNLFAYTGSASVYAAAGGAKSVTTVDLSQTYIDWAKRNMQTNGFAGSSFIFERADVLRWVTLARRSGKRYGLIFVDPPTFSNSKSMGKNTWDVQRDHVELLIGVTHLLSKEGLAIFSCNLKNFKPNYEKLEKYGVLMEDISADTIPFDFVRTPKIHKCYLVRRAQKTDNQSK